MTLPEPQAIAIRDALARLRATVESACEPGLDLDALKALLRQAAWERIDAYTLINDAERETRRAALQALEQAA